MQFLFRSCVVIVVVIIIVFIITVRTISKAFMPPFLWIYQTSRSSFLIHVSVCVEQHPLWAESNVCFYLFDAVPSHLSISRHIITSLLYRWFINNNADMTRAHCDWVNWGTDTNEWSGEYAFDKHRQTNAVCCLPWYILWIRIFLFAKRQQAFYYTKDVRNTWKRKWNLYQEPK